MEFKGAPAPWIATKREFFIELYDDNGNYVGLTNSKANAHLIATAPELLEALIEIVEMQSKNYGNGMVTHMQLANLAKKAKIVIEKALGQQ
ncbi:hypothetical protein AB8849_07095 [Proteus vulgaris]